MDRLPATHTLGSRGARKARRGLTLLELVLSFGVFLVGSLGFLQAIVLATKTGQVNRESAVATAAARQAIEALQAATFEEAYWRFNSDPGDDPATGVSPGSGIDVPGLKALPGDPDGLAGEILFPTVSAGGPLELREDVQNAAMGMPRDLNGDGAIDSANHKDDYRLLPVIVRFRWVGASGPASMEFRTLLADY